MDHAQPPCEKHLGNNALHENLLLFSYRHLSMKEFYVICDNIRSLENIGSIFRTADALAATKIFLCGISGKLPSWESAALHKKIGKTALGAEKNVLFEYCTKTSKVIEQLKKEKVFIVALEQHKKAIAYNKFKPKFPLALLLGNEVKGVSKKILEKCDAIIDLPMLGKKESLNVSVAFGIAGYELNKKRK